MVGLGKPENHRGDPEQSPGERRGDPTGGSIYYFLLLACNMHVKYWVRIKYIIVQFGYLLINDSDVNPDPVGSALFGSVNSDPDPEG